MNTAVVTGAGRGLGRLIAQGLADRGYAVLVTDIDEAAAHRAAEEIGSGAWAMHQDVRDPDSHRRAADEANARGSLRVWVNNAGVLRTGAVWQHPVDEIALQVDVNVTGLIHGARAAVDAMRDSGGGHIINIASISSLVPAPGVAVYGATKHAVLGFTTGLQGDIDEAGLPIKVSAVCPDAINTDMVRNVADTKGADLLFSSKKLLTADAVAKVTLDLLEDPKLVVIHPRGRGVMAHVAHIFPSFGLKVLQRFRSAGAKNRQSFSS